MTPAQKLDDILSRIQHACTSSGRDPHTVSLLAVSKTFPLSDVLALHACNQRAFGENYLQEALEKITQLNEHVQNHPNEPPIEWHFIGPIQSNKTKPIAEHFQWVHSVDRLKIAQRLSEQRPEHLPPLNVLVQVNTSGEESKSGVNPAEVIELCTAIHTLPKLTLRGLMTIPSNTANLTTLRQEFLLCKQLKDTLNQNGLSADTLSMGMSADLELAIECGSTCVRVGTALFGNRSNPINQ
jgi:PLP dependent protein